VEIEKRHDESVHRLQDWIRQPSIAAENRGMTEGCDLMMGLLRDAGFNMVTKVPTDGHPDVFATLDAGASRTFGIYFRYDVKQADPAEWSSPPFEAALGSRSRQSEGAGSDLAGRSARPRGTMVSADQDDD
jgi:acetylornithine deacetylase/succinyl-diaminopimelate desuccinylase-like protein